MARTIVNDGPEDLCFGCGHSNEHGLKLRFIVADYGEVEAEYDAPAHLRGAPGIVHGGIQATLLDEVLGSAIHAAIDEEDLDIVTAEFRLDYRRPAPCGVVLRIRGRLVRSEGRDYWAEGEILGPDDQILTRAEARWRRIRNRFAESPWP